MDRNPTRKRTNEAPRSRNSLQLALPKEGQLMPDNTDTQTPTAESQAAQVPNLSVADTVWNQIAASMDYPIYVLNAVREKFLQVSDDPNVVMFYREDARKNVALMNEAEVHIVTALQLIKQTLPILSAKYEAIKAATEELAASPSSTLVN